MGLRDAVEAPGSAYFFRAAAFFVAGLREAVRLLGAFAVAGLSPGTYIVRIEPLDDGDVESFFEASADVDADFRAKYYERLVTIPEGGGSVRIDVEVVPK